ncbi:hypothetical protein C4578_01310 [Candidatus Microgenomates bacterium]|nr:MAG: hypothetical protein C4578_01310 [Candidatus Microgenomates bacterium]
MKKTAVFFVIFLFLFNTQVFGQGNAPQMQNAIRKEIKEEVRESIKGIKEEARNEITEEKRLATPSGQAGQNIRSRILERIRKLYPKLLPAGLNQAEIKVISGNEITVTHESKEVKLLVTEKTVILKKYGGKALVSDLKVGHLVSARGTWQDSDNAVLELRILRDLSLQKRFATFWGKIKSLSEGKLVIETAKREDQAVLVKESTKIVNRAHKEIPFSELKEGHRVRVSGTWDSSLNQVEETRLIKDWSIAPVGESE